MDLVADFKGYISSVCGLRPSEKTLVAVSGGMDSMVLALLFLRSGYPFSIAHCNFGLRGAESDADESFVLQMARDHSKEVFTHRFETENYASSNGLSIQEAARKLRYEWFETLRLDQGFRWIATAHHQDDSLETLLINFFRGTGITGLHGILPVQGSLLRPLLFTGRREIQSFAEQEQIAFRVDSSNFSLKYTRNQVRLKLIPAIYAIFPEMRQSLLSNIPRFTDAGEIYGQMIMALRKKLVLKSGAEWKVGVLALSGCRPLATITYELFREFGFVPGQVRSLLDLLKGDPGRMVLSATHRVLRDRRWLIISALGQPGQDHFLVQEGDPGIETGDQQFRFSKIEVGERDPLALIRKDPGLAFLDLDQSGFPLMIRRWQTGDYFYPLGMKRKKKKLSRLFIDRKIPRTEKERIWVVVCGQRIVWVAGIRIDDRFKVTPSTRNILRIRMG